MAYGQAQSKENVSKRRQALALIDQRGVSVRIHGFIAEKAAFREENRNILRPVMGCSDD